jgi:guanylate kinase
MDQHGRSLQFISKSELKQMRKDGKSLELLHTHNPEPAEPKLTLWERLRDNKTGKEIDLRERQRVSM